MRVLTFLHSFEPGGVERVALRLIRHWRAAGIDAPLFMGRAEGALREELTLDLHYDLPAWQPRGVSAWETLWMVWQLPGQVRRQRPDILFCAGSTYTIVAVLLRLWLGRNCPPIVAKISNDLARTDLPWAARMAWRMWLSLQARFVDIWVLMDAAMVVDAPPGIAARMRVIPDPAISDAQIRTSFPAPQLRIGRRFLAVGRLVGQKDYPLMLRAFAAGRRPDDSLTILGEGPARAEMEALIAQLAIGDHVRMMGHVADASSWLSDYDALLLSSRYEGVPAVIVEALASGTPIVATECGSGVRGLLRGGQLGALVPRDEASLADAIAADVDSWRPAPGEAAEQARRFTIERTAAVYLAAFGDAERHPVSALSPA